MQIIDAFIKPCNASVHTVRKVAMCPSSNVSYKKAAMKKNCPSLSADALKCRSFEYHCVLSDDRKYAIEVCAPSINKVGKNMIFHTINDYFLLINISNKIVSI